MENTPPAPSKGYQKKVVKDAPPPKPKRDPNAPPVDYSSPAAKKWPKLIEAIERGNIETLQQLIDEGINVNVIRDGSTPLMIAASKGKPEVAGVLLQAGVNINEKNEDGWTALHKAAFEQPGSGIVELLVHSGIDVDAKNKSGKTALQLAEEKKHRDIIRVIKLHHAQLETDAREWEEFLNSIEGKPYKQKRTYDSLSLVFKLWWVPGLLFGGLGALIGLAFDATVIAGIAGFLIGLSVGVGILAFERKIRTYLDTVEPLPELDIHMLREQRKNAGQPHAAAPPDTAAVEWTPPSDDITAELGLSSSSLESSLDLAPVDEGAFIEKDDPVRARRLLIVNISLITILILLSIVAVFVNRTTLTRMYYAKKLTWKKLPLTEQAFLGEVAHKNEEVIDLFLKAGMSSNARNDQGRTALMIAAEKGHVNILNKMARLDPASLNRIDKNGNTALMLAARLGQADSVAALIACNADVNYTVPSQDSAATALQAVLDVPEFKEEHTAVVRILLQHGADVKGRNAAGRSSLSFAAGHGRADIAKVLIESGADVNDADQKGNFPLLLAACKGYPSFITLLADKGANMNLALPDGQTPLMCAVKEGQNDTIRVLLERGAPINATTATGSTALTEATRAGNVDAVRMLLAQGADPSHAYLPDTFTGLSGAVVAITAKKSKTGDVLGRIAKTASQDGYTITNGPASDLRITLKTKAAWNKVLVDLAARSRMVLVVKDKTITVIPSTAPTGKNVSR